MEIMEIMNITEIVTISSIILSSMAIIMFLMGMVGLVIFYCLFNCFNGKNKNILKFVDGKNKNNDSEDNVKLVLKNYSEYWNDKKDFIERWNKNNDNKDDNKDDNKADNEAYNKDNINININIIKFILCPVLPIYKMIMSFAFLGNSKINDKANDNTTDNANNNTTNNTADNTNDKNCADKLKCLIFEIDYKTEIKLVKKIVNTILTNKVKPNKVVVKINSPGGGVSHYGLIYAELLRIKNCGIELIVCIDNIAASGGYLISCCADKIIASKFALIGSIGVITQMSNFKKIADKIGVKFDTFTAGKNKLMYDQFGENSEEQINYIKNKLSNVHDLFKETIKEHRKNVNIEEISDGDVWYGEDALKLGLIDKILTSDEYLFELNNDHDIIEIKEEKSNGNIFDVKSLIKKIVGMSHNTILQYL